MTFGHDANRVAEYFLWLARENGNPLTPMQLLKLVYIAHGWMLGLYGRPLLASRVEAWPYGPVVPDVYHRFKRFRDNFISDCPQHEPGGFSGSERSVMKQVWDAYGRYSGVRLSALTHQPGTPWHVVYHDGKGKGRVIPNDIIEEHYRRLSEQGQATL